MYGLCSPCGLRGCKNWPTPFPGRMSYKATKPGLVSVLYLSMRYIVLLFIRAPFCVLLVFVAVCSVFWLFWLSCHYLPSDWLERLLWGSLIVARGSPPESPGRRLCTIFLLHCIVSLFYYIPTSRAALRDIFVLSPAPTWYIFLLLWRNIAYLCWKCHWIPSKQTSMDFVAEYSIVSVNYVLLIFYFNVRLLSDFIAWLNVNGTNLGLLIV